MTSRQSDLDWINSVEGEKGRIRDADIYPRLKAWTDRVAPKEILEIGCGQGICSDKIDLESRNYTGLELSPLLLDRAKQLYGRPNRTFLAGNAYALPFPIGFFDAVFSVAVLHLLADAKKAAEELSRVLKPGAHFLIISANPGAYSTWIESYTDTQTQGRRFEGSVRLSDQSVAREVLYLHPLQEIMDSLQCAQLVVQASETFRTVGASPGCDRFISIQGQKSR